MAAQKTSDVPTRRLLSLNEGKTEVKTLVEALAMDFSLLLEHVFPDMEQDSIDRMKAAKEAGVTRRMALGGELILSHLGGIEAAASLINHPSDTIRGWACFAVGAQNVDAEALLKLIRPFADDSHFGVREWAWLAVRPRLAADLENSVRLLSSWSLSPSERIRRFASECLRPRGVWCAHIRALKERPGLGLPILEPLKADPALYVRDSVANWLNDAGKTQPDWVREITDRWLSERPGDPAVVYVAKRACRSFPGEKRGRSLKTRL